MARASSPRRTTLAERRRRRRPLRARLLSAGRTLFCRNGFSRTTIEDVCRRAGAAKGAFFHHFRGKDQLAAELLEVHFAEMREVIRSAVAGATDPGDAIDRYFEASIRTYEDRRWRDGCLLGVMAAELGGGKGVIAAACRRSFVEWRGALERLVALADPARKSNVRPRDFAEQFQAIVQGSFLVQRATGDTGIVIRSLEEYRRYVRSAIRSVLD